MKSMQIAIVKETAPAEKRVLVLPEEVEKLVGEGQKVLVEKNAGYGIHVYDKDYERVGAKIIESRKQIFGESDLIVKLKAPTIEEFALLNKNILFSMLHHAQNPQHIYFLGEKGAKAVEMESIKNETNERLIDATDITGEIGVLYAVQHMAKTPQESRALILGYGRVGSGAIKMCNKLNINIKILRREEYPYLEYFLKGRDLLINAIAWSDENRKNRNYIVTRDMIELMDPDGVILDLSVDFPNPIQTCRPTSLNNPFYIEKDRVHIGIYGYPGLVPVSSSKRYSKQALPLILEIAKNNGLEKIADRGELGKYIQKAIVDPKEMDWEKLEPVERVESLIE